MLLPLCARPKNELFLLRAQSLQLAHAAVAARGLELLDGLDAELGIEQRDRFRADALEVEQVEYRRRKLLEQILVIARLAGLGNLADLRRQLFADAGNGAQLLFVAGTRACSVAWAIVSDAFRYARILNGFSLLISSRSAISEKMRAMARFSMSHRNDARRTSATRTEPEDRRSQYGNPSTRAPPDVSACRTAGTSFGSTRQNRHPPPPAPHTFAARAPAAKRIGDERLDHRRRHAGCQLLARLPFEVDVRGDAGPIAAGEGVAHTARRLDDAIEALEDVAVAVDVALHDFPVVRAGEMRRAGVGEHDAALQLDGIDSRSRCA